MAAGHSAHRALLLRGRAEVGACTNVMQFFRVMRSLTGHAVQGMPCCSLTLSRLGSRTSSPCMLAVRSCKASSGPPPNGALDLYYLQSSYALPPPIHDSMHGLRRIHTSAFHPEWLELNEQKKREGKAALQPLPEDCEDFSVNCKDWSSRREIPGPLADDPAMITRIIFSDAYVCLGECERNEKYMVGDDYNLGQCRASCMACEVCAAGDRACRDRNRVASGFLVTPDGED